MEEHLGLLVAEETFGGTLLPVLPGALVQETKLCASYVSQAWVQI